MQIPFKQILPKIILCILILHCYICNAQKIKPIQAFSISLNETAFALETQKPKNKWEISHNLTVASSQLQKQHNEHQIQIVGSISQMDLRTNPFLQFSFVYKLHKNNSTVSIVFTAKNTDSSQIHPHLFITLDFFIALFPKQTQIQQFNMTTYQWHLDYNKDTSYEMLFFLNGFNNASMSGNVTHSYQYGADIATVHYMTCEGEQMEMGWKNDHDYILFTIVVVKYEDSVQKFKISDKDFRVEVKKGKGYFYGIKGVLDNKFVGGFTRGKDQISFHSENAQVYHQYGLSLFSFAQEDSESFKDERVNQSETIPFYLIIGLCGLVFLIVGIYFGRRCINHQDLSALVEETVEDKQITDNFSHVILPKQYKNSIVLVDEGSIGNEKGQIQ